MYKYQLLFPLCPPSLLLLLFSPPRSQLRRKLIMVAQPTTSSSDVSRAASPGISEIHSTLTTNFERPQDVGILAMEMYFPRRVCMFFTRFWLKLDLPSSASQRRTSRSSMALPRENTLLVLVRSTWPVQMIVRISTHSLSLVSTHFTKDIKLCLTSLLLDSRFIATQKI